jgi:hypothetical protein
MSYASDHGRTIAGIRHPDLGGVASALGGSLFFGVGVKLLCQRVLLPTGSKPTTLSASKSADD